MTTRIAVAGATGYAGSEILRLLLSHPHYHSGELEIGALCAHSSAGALVGELMPHLPQLAQRRIEETSAATLDGHDVVFLALPHGHSAAIAAELREVAAQHQRSEPLIIDCAADHRLKDPQHWEEFYGGEHPGSWAYGMPELPGAREQLRTASRVAVPGCFPTAISLGAAPALAHGLIEPDLSIIAVTGVSGAGKKASVDLLGAETMSNLRAYKPGGTHRHTPEIIQNLEPLLAPGTDITVSFTPILAPLPRGILATITAPLTERYRDLDQEQITDLFTQYYAEEPFCVVLPAGQQPQTHNVVGSNMVHIQAHRDARAGKLVITAAVDNLTKGTGGAAVQCMNLALGWPEAAGLTHGALAP